MKKCNTFQFIWTSSERSTNRFSKCVQFWHLRLFKKEIKDKLSKPHCPHKSLQWAAPFFTISKKRNSKRTSELQNASSQLQKSVKVHFQKQKTSKVPRFIDESLLSQIAGGQNAQRIPQLRRPSIGRCRHVLGPHVPRPSTARAPVVAHEEQLTRQVGGTQKWMTQGHQKAQQSKTSGTLMSVVFGWSMMICFFLVHLLVFF